MIHRKLQRFCSIGYWLAALFLLQLLPGCSKDPVSSGGEVIDRTRTGYVLEDNFNFSVCNGLLVYTGQTKLLKGSAASTFLASDNDAFSTLGLRIRDIPSSQYDNNWCITMASYSTVPGVQSFRKLPLGDNQPVLTGNGHYLYVSRYLPGTDTITRVNGVLLSDTDIKTGNGLLQVLTQVIQPENVSNLQQFILGDTTLTLFTLAIQHSGLLPLLQTGEYTLLAPVNEVMRQKGAIKPGLNLTTPDSILATNPTELATLLKYHLLKGRCFLDRIHRMADTAANHALTTLSGERLVIGGDAQTYNSTTFSGNKNNTSAKIYRWGYERYNFANFPAGNGVVHHIDNILLP
ncbi:fasciclin domain-containing protein [Chitinophaga sp. RAB17]|uniref:fasciclin domain-containing protein n=1 Tax=Chitinophaga sp. RAB17 TaxID=3233049 RepID=UPI003F8ECF60